jgi:hypothetical protein
MRSAVLFLWNSRTTALGYLVVVLGVLAATDGIFSPRTLKVLLLANGIVTACLGHYNNLKIRQANQAGSGE